MSAPERIWLTTTASGEVDDFTQWLDSTIHLHPEAPRTEYVRADLARPQWQPIETAPRDWTTIVAMRDESGRRGVTIIFWDAYEAEWCGTTAENERMLVKFAPTHWMPLPAPPADP